MFHTVEKEKPGQTTLPLITRFFIIFRNLACKERHILTLRV